LLSLAGERLHPPGRALVTGCAGFIGSHLVESLLDDGWVVLGIDSFLSNYDAARKRRNLEVALDADDFKLFESDLVDSELSALLEGCDIVFHLAAEPGVRTSWGDRFDSYVRNNVLATQRLLEAVKERPLARFVYSSSSSIYGQAERLPTPESTLPRPFSPYGVTKLGAEHLCQLYHGNHGVPTSILRYFSVYGPRQRPDMAFHRFCRAAIEGRPLRVFGSGDQVRDFTYIRDVVSATRAAAQIPAAIGKVYNVGGGSQVALTHAIHLLEEFAGRALALERTGAQRGDVNATGADISRAQADLDYQPSVQFADGLWDEFTWMLAGVSTVAEI
jgi:nucleoside-diphosphate-sugar epimerase